MYNEFDKNYFNNVHEVILISFIINSFQILIYQHFNLFFLYQKQLYFQLTFYFLIISQLINKSHKFHVNILILIKDNFFFLFLLKIMDFF